MVPNPGIRQHPKSQTQAEMKCTVAVRSLAGCQMPPWKAQFCEFQKHEMLSLALQDSEADNWILKVLLCSPEGLAPGMLASTRQGDVALAGYYFITIKIKRLRNSQALKGLRGRAGSRWRFLSPEHKDLEWELRVSTCFSVFVFCLFFN